MNFLRASLAAGICLGMAVQSWGAPLSLQDCLQKARDNNPTLKSAAWDSRIAEENSRLASAAIYPRVDVTAGYTMQLKPQAAILDGFTAETQDPDFAFASAAATPIRSTISAAAMPGFGRHAPTPKPLSRGSCSAKAMLPCR